MTTRIADPEISNDKLIQIIRTGVPSAEGLSKMRALVAFRRSRSTRKVEVFSSVFANRQEPPRFRHLAIGGLLELGGARAERALIENAQHMDELTADTLANALGRIGSPAAMPVLRDILAAARPAVRKRVDFAISLLAYRHNLPGDEVEVPTDDQLLSISAGAETLAIVVDDANQAEVEVATSALKREPLGIELTPEGAQRIECGPNGLLLVWNQEFGGSRLSKLRERKGVAGVLFLKSRFENDVCVSSLVLVTPGPGRRDFKISIHKTWGAVVYAGAVSFEGESSANLRLRSIRRPGAAAMEFSGTVTNGRLTIEGAQSAARVLNRRVPTSDANR